MRHFSRNTPRNNPRLILTVNSDESATLRGCYIDSRNNVSSIARTYNSEELARAELDVMRNRDCEFSYIVNRKAGI